MDERLKLYKTIPARLNIIDLDIQFKELLCQEYKKLIKIKNSLLEEKACIENLLERLNESELFIISLLYNTGVSITELSILLRRSRNTLSKKVNMIIKKLEK